MDLCCVLGMCGIIILVVPVCTDRIRTIGGIRIGFGDGSI